MCSELQVSFSFMAGTGITGEKCDDLLPTGLRGAVYQTLDNQVAQYSCMIRWGKLIIR